MLGRIENFDAIIPVPPSNKARRIQPVDEIAKALGAQRNVDVLVGFLQKQAGSPEIKGVDDPNERHNFLKNSIKIVGDRDISGKRILLIDDLYSSGETLGACADILHEDAKIVELSVLTMTKTRSKR